MQSINATIVCLLLAVIISISASFPLQSIYAQIPNPNSTQTNSTTNSQTQWKVYTTNKFGFSIEYPQSWITSEKQSKYESGVELTIESPDIWDPNNGRFNFVAALPVPASNIEALTNFEVEKIVRGFDVEFDKRLIGGVNVTKYEIDGEKAGAFTFVIDSKEYVNPVPVVTIEVVSTIHNGKAYVFQFMSKKDNFDNPTLTDIRQHMFNSIKWLRAGNQTTASTATTDFIPYTNPNLGFSLEYPSKWQKEESLTFVSPQGGVDNGAPEIISITTEVLPTSDFSLDRYSEAVLGQVESFQDFKLLNSSSTTFAGLPAHMIEYSFTDESQTPLQNLQMWTIKDGMAYIITYGGTPEEFNNSLPALQSVDSFSFKQVQ